MSKCDHGRPSTLGKEEIDGNIERVSDRRERAQQFPSPRDVYISPRNEARDHVVTGAQVPRVTGTQAREFRSERSNKNTGEQANDELIYDDAKTVTICGSERETSRRTWEQDERETSRLPPIQESQEVVGGKK